MKRTVTRRQIQNSFTQHGFSEHPAPGFVGFHRFHPTDGRFQQLHVFTWSNPKAAERQGIPSAYLVICPTIDEPKGLEGLPHPSPTPRFRIPLVHWPSEKQEPRNWQEVVDEYERVFLPAFELPLPAGNQHLGGLEDRYTLTPPPSSTT